MDKSDSKVFLLLTHMENLGGIPLGLFICQSEKSDVVRRGLMLITRLAESNSFGGKGYPEVCMTDDSATERKAVTDLWPDCTLLLCAFHVAQAYWRWLSKMDNIPVTSAVSRKEHFQMFQHIMYSTTEEQMQERLVLVVCIVQ